MRRAKRGASPRRSPSSGGRNGVAANGRRGGGGKDPASSGGRRADVVDGARDSAPRAPAEHRDVDRNLIGLTYTGERFKVPETRHALDVLLRVWQPAVAFSWLGFLVTAAVLAASFDRAVLPDWAAHALDTLNLPTLPKWSVLVPAAFWRVMYNVGLGGLLRAQSKTAWLTRAVAAIMRPANKGSLADWWVIGGVRNTLGLRADEPLPPAEFAAWVVARQWVNVVLPNDVVAFACAALRYIDLQYECATSLWAAAGLPQAVCDSIYYAGYVVGVGLIYASVLSKVHSHRVIGEYAWHWGDFFFLVERETELKFDGIYEIAPHPMYSAGYGWTYGAALISRSWTVMAMALAAHLLQLVFLAVVETPHIEKLYGGSGGNGGGKQGDQVKYTDANIMLLHNFDPFRAGDWSLVIAVTLMVALGIAVSQPDPDASGRPMVSNQALVAGAIILRVVTVAITGAVLWAQDRTQFWTRHFEHDQPGSQPGSRLPAVSHDEAKRVGFEEWRRLQNVLQVVPSVAFFIAAAREWALPSREELLHPQFWSLHGIAAMLIILSLWAFSSSYSESGDYAWFYGDFFVPPPNDATVLTYDGAYRFLNHPDVVLGYLGYYGVAIACRSWPLAAAALVTHGVHVVLLNAVELPHSRKLYAKAMRADAALSRHIKQGARRARAALAARLRLYE